MSNFFIWNGLAGGKNDGTEVETNGGLFGCPTCGQTFGNQDKLSRHGQEAWRQNEYEPLDWTNPQGYNPLSFSLFGAKLALDRSQQQSRSQFEEHFHDSLRCVKRLVLSNVEVAKHLK